MITDEQHEELRVRHWRFGLTVFSRRYFMTVRIGEERRDPVRLESEGQVSVPTGAVASGTAGAAFFLLFGIACALYLLKAMAGINLFADASIFHPLYALFFG